MSHAAPGQSLPREADALECNGAVDSIPSLDGEVQAVLKLIATSACSSESTIITHTDIRLLLKLSWLLDHLQDYRVAGAGPALRSRVCLVGPMAHDRRPLPALRNSERPGNPPILTLQPVE